MNRPSLRVEPTVAQVDEPVSIRASGLPPNAEVVVRARMQEFMGHSWSADATFSSGPDGTIDANLDEPLRGAYRDADSMGLFWSMSLIGNPEINSYLPTSVEPLRVELSIEANGEAVASAVASRQFMAPGVTRVEVREDGLVGTLFRPAAATALPAVVTLGGSGGGISEPTAALLSGHGFASLALAYFGIEHLPSGIVEIPLEYCHKAVSWLQRQRFVLSDGIGVLGQSRGGELALLIGSSCPDIRAVVAYVPSGVAWNATEPAGSERPVRPSSWTLNGKPLPFMSNDRDAVDWKSKAIALTPAYRSALGDVADVARSEIPVERTRGPILMVSGQDDNVWPSQQLADIAMRRLQRSKFEFSAEHLSYPHAGHVLNVPFLPTTIRQFHHPIRKFAFSLGGTPHGDALARRESWRKVVAFLKHHLATA